MSVNSVYIDKVGSSSVTEHEPGVDIPVENCLRLPCFVGVTQRITVPRDWTCAARNSNNIVAVLYSSYKCIIVFIQIVQYWSAVR